MSNPTWTRLATSAVATVIAMLTCLATSTAAYPMFNAFGEIAESAIFTAELTQMCDETIERFLNLPLDRSALDNGIELLKEIYDIPDCQVVLASVATVRDKNPEVQASLDLVMGSSWSEYFRNMFCYTSDLSSRYSVLVQHYSDINAYFDDSPSAKTELANFVMPKNLVPFQYGNQVRGIFRPDLKDNSIANLDLFIAYKDLIGTKKHHTKPMLPLTFVTDVARFILAIWKRGYYIQNSLESCIYFAVYSSPDTSLNYVPQYLVTPKCMALVPEDIPKPLEYDEEEYYSQYRKNTITEYFKLVDTLLTSYERSYGNVSIQSLRARYVDDVLHALDNQNEKEAFSASHRNYHVAADSNSIVDYLSRLRLLRDLGNPENLLDDNGIHLTLDLISYIRKNDISLNVLAGDILTSYGYFADATSTRSWNNRDDDTWIKCVQKQYDSTSDALTMVENGIMIQERFKELGINTIQAPLRSFVNPILEKVSVCYQFPANTGLYTRKAVKNSSQFQALHKIIVDVLHIAMSDEDILLSLVPPIYTEEVTLFSQETISLVTDIPEYPLNDPLTDEEKTQRRQAWVHFGLVTYMVARGYITNEIELAIATRVLSNNKFATVRSFVEMHSKTIQFDSERELLHLLLDAAESGNLNAESSNAIITNGFWESGMSLFQFDSDSNLYDDEEEASDILDSDIEGGNPLVYDILRRSKEITDVFTCTNFAMFYDVEYAQELLNRARPFLIDIGISPFMFYITGTTDSPLTLQVCTMANSLPSMPDTDRIDTSSEVVGKAYLYAYGAAMGPQYGLYVFYSPDGAMMAALNDRPDAVSDMFELLPADSISDLKALAAFEIFRTLKLAMTDYHEMGEEDLKSLIVTPEAMADFQEFSRNDPHLIESIFLNLRHNLHGRTSKQRSSGDARRSTMQALTSGGVDNDAYDAFHKHGSSHGDVHGALQWPLRGRTRFANIIGLLDKNPEILSDSSPGNIIINNKLGLTEDNLRNVPISVSNTPDSFQTMLPPPLEDDDEQESQPVSRNNKRVSFDLPTVRTYTPEVTAKDKEYVSRLDTEVNELREVIEQTKRIMLENTFDIQASRNVAKGL